MFKFCFQKSREANIVAITSTNPKRGGSPLVSILGRNTPDRAPSAGGSQESDLLQNLLGIEDSAIDKMLDSADSAAKMLGV